MKAYTWKELENMSVIELCKLCKAYGMSMLSMRTFTYKQKIAFVHSQQFIKEE